MLAHEPVVAVAGVGVERDVGDEAEFGEFLLDRPAGAADEVALVVGLGPVLVLEMRLGVGEEGDRGDVELHRALGLAHRLVDAEPLDARHCRNGHAGLLALDQEQRPDEVVGGQHLLADQPPRPFRLAVAAGPVGEVEAMGFDDAGRLVHGFRTPSPRAYTPHDLRGESIRSRTSFRCVGRARQPAGGIR